MATRHTKVTFRDWNKLNREAIQQASGPMDPVTQSVIEKYHETVRKCADVLCGQGATLDDLTLENYQHEMATALLWEKMGVGYKIKMAYDRLPVSVRIEATTIIRDEKGGFN